MTTHSKWHGKQCPVCFKGTLADGVRDEEVTYQGAVFKWHEHGAYCNVCNDGIVEGNVDHDTAFAAFRETVDARVAADMETIRVQLRLSKTDMTHLVGGGKNGYGRYISRQTTPTPAVWNLVRALQAHPDLVEQLKKPFMEVDADDLPVQQAY